MTEDMFVAALAGGTVIAILGIALIKLLEIARKVRRTVRRWGRTRLTVTQAARRRKGARRG